MKYSRGNKKNQGDLGVGQGAPVPPFVREFFPFSKLVSDAGRMVLRALLLNIFSDYMFNMESRHLLNLSVQNALDCISENFNLKNFPGGARARNSQEKCAVQRPDERFPYCHCIPYISRPPLSQNPPSTLFKGFLILYSELRVRDSV